MSVGRVIVGGAVLGAAYLLWQQQERTSEAVFIPAHAPAPERRDLSGIVSEGINLFMNLTGSSRTGTAESESTADKLVSSFGRLIGYQTQGTPETPQRAGQGVATSTGPILALIGRLEAPRGYDQVYGGTKLQPPRPITTMTIEGVLDWQDRSVAAGSRSSAAGRYQIIRKTLRGLVRSGHASMSDTFDRRTQDRLAHALLERRGWSKFQSGRISAASFGNNLSKEWASLPVITGPKRGRSFYAGDGLNRTHTTPETVLAALSGSYV